MAVLPFDSPLVWLFTPCNKHHVPGLKVWPEILASGLEFRVRDKFAEFTGLVCGLGVGVRTRCTRCIYWVNKGPY